MKIQIDDGSARRRHRAGRMRRGGRGRMVFDEKPARRFKAFSWSTRDSWSRQRRVIGKAEWTAGAANPRFVVTPLSPEAAGIVGELGEGTGANAPIPDLIR